MNYYKDFKNTWLDIYIKQYKDCKNIVEKRAIRENLFKNVHLTYAQKSNLWERIVKA